MLSTMPSSYAVLLIDLVRQQQLDINTLCAGTSLQENALTNIPPRISLVDFSALVNNALKLTSNPALGLALGQRINMSAHAVLGQVFLACSNLGQVLDVFLRYAPLLTPATTLKLVETEEEVTLAFNIGSLLQEIETPLEFNHELMCAAILNTLRGLLYNQALSVSVNCPYPAPSYAEQYITAFGRRVQFNAPQASISFAKTLLTRPLPTANPALLNLYEAECAKLLKDLDEPDSIGAQLEKVLAQIQGQYPNLTQAANMLNLSPRTLRRRLAVESQSYQHILDAVRRKQARHYLQHSELPISSIAYLLGFNDASNFRRAYQRWTGETPSNTRKSTHG